MFEERTNESISDAKVSLAATRRECIARWRKCVGKSSRRRAHCKKDENIATTSWKSTTVLRGSEVSWIEKRVN